MKTPTVPIQVRSIDFNPVMPSLELSSPSYNLKLSTSYSYRRRAHKPAPPSIAAPISSEIFTAVKFRIRRLTSTMNNV